MLPLIVPYGIETYGGKTILEEEYPLIVPYGIETYYVEEDGYIAVCL